MRKYLRLYRQILVQAFVRESHYRVNLFAAAGVGLVQIALGLLPILLIFQYATDIGGWTRLEVVALAGLHQMTSGVLATFVRPNLVQMGRYINMGDLDAVLLRPVSSQFLVTFRWLNLAQLVHVVVGLAILVTCLALDDARPTPVGIVQGLVLWLCGLVLITCAWSAMTYLVFWLQRVYAIIALIDSTFESGRYPVTFFPTLVRIFLTFAFPVAFATTFPVEALTGGITWLTVLGGIALCVVAIWSLRNGWRYVLRRYSSASS